ncbi:MAG: CPBP family intramembrane metalloprotease [Chloroflexi bacterium]|nr:CPBP family intramembrane metalloprotease [Chloroflexota bacterium]
MDTTVNTALVVLPPAAPVSDATPQPGEVPWNGGDVVRGILLVIAIVVGLLIIATITKKAGASDAGTVVPLTVLLELSFLWTVWRVVAKKHGWRAVGYRALDLKAAWGTIGRNIVIAFGAALVYAWILNATGLTDKARSQDYLNDPHYVIRAGIAFSAIVLAPICEETFFRGFALQGLRNRFGPMWSVILASLLFALAHISYLAYAPIFIVGIILARVFQRTGSIFANMLVHAGYNGIIVAIALSVSK